MKRTAGFTGRIEESAPADGTAAELYCSGARSFLCRSRNSVCWRLSALCCAASSSASSRGKVHFVRVSRRGPLSRLQVHADVVHTTSATRDGILSRVVRTCGKRIYPWQPCASFFVRTRPVRSSRPQGASHPISLAALRELPRPYAAGTLVEASRRISPLREHPFWGSPSARDRKVDGSIPDSYNPPSSRYESAPLVFGRFAFGEMALASKGNGSKHRTRGRPGRVPRSFGWTRPEVDMALAKDLVNRERSGAVAALARASSSVRGRHGS